MISVQESPIQVTVSLNGQNKVVQVETETVLVTEIAQGVAGPPGADGNSQPTIYFAYGDATPTTIFTASDDLVIKSITLIVLTAFNGVGAKVKIGTDANSELLMAESENSLSVVGSFETSPNETVLDGTEIKVFITPGAGATQGQAGILIEYGGA